MRISFLSVLILNLIIAPVWLSRLKPLIPSEDYTHFLIIDEDKPEQYQLFWKLLNRDEIQFEIHCKSTGWVALGFSPNGKMPGSDIAIGWVKENKAVIKDCYAETQSSPSVDIQQDIKFLDGNEIEGYTILKFKRKLTTCDEKFDRKIEKGTQYMIFAWNNADPVTGNNDWKYHGANRITKTVMLLNYKNETLLQQSQLPNDTFTYTMKTNNVYLPPKDTFYFCDLYPLPYFTKAVHLIQFEVLVNPRNKPHFHHILVYECNAAFKPNKTLAQECGREPLPTDVSSSCMQKLFIAWGIGGQYNYRFPKKAGYRFESTTTVRYLLVEIHYDNPQLLSNIVDDSGIKLYFTEQLREHDLGLLKLGSDGNPLSLQIPPSSNSFTYASICYPECTDKYFPKDGINVVSGMLHTNLAGRSVKTTLFRNDVAIQDIFSNQNYDFNFQPLMDIEPLKLFKGDVLITECRYNTSDRNKFTFFGFGSENEMCYDFMYYYPVINNLQTCFTATPSQVLYDFYKSLMDDMIIPILPVTAPIIYLIQDFLIDYFQNIVRPTPELIKRFEAFFNSSYNKTVFCGDITDYLYIESLAHYTPIKYQIPVTNTCNSEVGETQTSLQVTSTKQTTSKIQTMSQDVSSSKLSTINKETTSQTSGSVFSTNTFLSTQSTSNGAMKAIFFYIGIYFIVLLYTYMQI